MKSKLIFHKQTRLECLDGDWSRVVPDTLIDLAKLPGANLSDELQRSLGDFPLVFRVVR